MRRREEESGDPGREATRGLEKAPPHPILDGTSRTSPYILVHDGEATSADIPIDELRAVSLAVAAGRVIWESACAEIPS